MKCPRGVYEFLEAAMGFAASFALSLSNRKELERRAVIGTLASR